MIQNLLDELQTTWGFGPEELADIKEKMACYAISADLDTDIRDEAYQIYAISADLYTDTRDEAYQIYEQ